MNSKDKRFKELDALRGIACISVILFHYNINNEFSKLGFSYGITGVDFFFIISGFVIFMSINNCKSLFDFFINRFIRIFPTYWICVTLTFILKSLIISYKPNDIIIYFTNLSMFQSYFLIENIDGSYWTMIIELIFYIIIGLIFYLKKLNQIVLICSISLLFILFKNVFIGHVFNKIETYILILFPIYNYISLFFAGILFYKIFTETEKTNVFIYYILLLFCFIIKVWFSDFEYFRISKIITHYEYIYILSIYFIIFIIFVNNLLHFIVNPITLFLGKISFALYLIHQYIGTMIIIPFFHTNLNLNLTYSVFIAILISISIATIITFGIEKPFGLRIKTYLLKLKK